MESQGAIEAAFRIEAPRVIAALTRLVRDVGLAEELSQDALVQALQQWPLEGVPRNPGAWLLSAAKRRAIDRIRRDRRWADREAKLAAEDSPQSAEPPLEYVPDDLLRLLFISCHPVLPMEGRVALTLRLLGGLSTSEIARAFLAEEPAIAQRIVRAKRTLVEARVPFELPEPEALSERLSSVLEVLYLVFNEGYSATAGEDVIRPSLCEEAIRLCRVLAGLTPSEREVLGLLALMELQASRLHARVAADGTPILLLDQSRARWDRLLISHGLNVLARTRRLSGTAGPYELQAEIAACHARARTAEQTDWERIAQLYGALYAQQPSPVIALNRAVAIGMAIGPAAALPLVEALYDEPKLRGYYLLPSVRGDLLFKLGRSEEAAAEFERAAQLTQNAREQAFLRSRARAARGVTEP